MKLLIILLSAGLLVTSCTSPNTVTTNTGSTDAVSKNQTQASQIAKSGDTVKVDYVGRFADGKIFDSSLESEAKKMEKYSENSGRTYEPLMTKLQEGGGTISGFWKGIVGMKIGETKKVTIAPEDGYGTEWASPEESVVDKKIFDETLVRTIKKSETLDEIKMDVPKEDLEREGKLPKVGDILTNEREIKAKVTVIGDKNISLIIDNSKNPFSGKKLVKGEKVTFEDGNIGTITKVTPTDITLSIKNTSNPFFGKTLAVGLEGIYKDSQKVKITKIEKDTVTISIQSKNTHPLAGKTLEFELTLKEIK